MNLPVKNVQCFDFQGQSFNWFVGLVIHLGWIENEALLHLFQRNIELKSVETSDHLFLLLQDSLMI
jgi:hypothetical protein